MKQAAGLQAAPKLHEQLKSIAEEIRKQSARRRRRLVTGSYQDERGKPAAFRNTRNVIMV